MPVRKASATWNGTLRQGDGSFESQSGAIGGKYSFGTRFEESPGTNPEELLAAAEASCFSMALAGNVEKAGHTPERIETSARCTLEKSDAGFTITTMALSTTVTAPGLEQAELDELAQQTKQTCTVSRALAGDEISVEAKLG